MIIVYLQGGMGNQMFQYAAGRRLAFRLGVSLKLDLSRLSNTEPGITPRAYALAPFPIKAALATPEESRRLWQKSGWWGGRLWQTIKPGYRQTHIRERGFRFDPAILELGDDVCLDGYWQSEKYFVDAVSVLRRDFTLPSPPAGSNGEVLRQITGCQSVSLHIRRGDYLTNRRIAAKHGSCSERYYQEAVAMIAARVSQPHFFVFSDDPGWVRDHFAIPHPMTVVEHNSPDQPHEDLRLMSSCQHHITANSSFSWWGAWLGEHPGKVVIAPARWFNDPSIDTADLLPASWLKVES
ncbi:alpha-1,2-fucosyltransferase [Geomonas sp. Red259]|uniref:Alpha-1,2-fucosyltransferase n=1 Tax=Geomonas propionica TaxID=2798582 RepID=A0ABS0YMX4_9BACT|nr:alpha-1,2-fucosyltransferase [Geomonas propionica]